MRQENYPKLGGDLTYACERLARGINAVGVMIAIYRGLDEEIELGMTFAANLKFDSKGFRKLTDLILDGDYSASISKADKVCMMLVEATDAESVILFAIQKDGTVSIAVSRPMPKEFIAGLPLQIANHFDAMN